jgi:uncharacterized RDD family membrane protein YckC
MKEPCMSSNEPPAGSTPPPGEPTPPPPPPTGDPAAAAAPPPPPPPAASYGAPAPAPGVPGALSGPGAPGNLLDRFLARLIDGIIVGVVYGIVYSVLNAAAGYWPAVFIGGIVSAVLYLGYFSYLESNRGQTIGKQVMKLKTVGPDGHSNPTMNEAVKRNIWNAFNIVPCIGPLAALASVILIAVNINSDPKRQHYFDKFAGGTQVLKVG